MRHAGEAVAGAASGRDLPQLDGLRGPMFIFLACSMICMFASSFCHAFYCVGQEISRIIWRFDYVGEPSICSWSSPLFHGRFSSHSSSRLRCLLRPQ